MARSRAAQIEAAAALAIDLIAREGAWVEQGGPDDFDAEAAYRLDQIADYVSGDDGEDVWRAYYLVNALVAHAGRLSAALVRMRAEVVA